VRWDGESDGRGPRRPYEPANRFLFQEQGHSIHSMTTSWLPSARRAVLLAGGVRVDFDQAASAVAISEPRSSQQGANDCDCVGAACFGSSQ